MLWFHNHGYGNTGATSGHLIPDYSRVLCRRAGKASTPSLQEQCYQALPAAEQNGAKGAQLRAMLTSATMARDVAGEYRQRMPGSWQRTKAIQARQSELKQMAENLERVPWEPAADLLGGGAGSVADPHAGDDR